MAPARPGMDRIGGSAWFARFVQPVKTLCTSACLVAHIRVCVRAYVRMYVRMYVHTYMRMYVRVYAHTRVRVYVHIHTYTQAYVHTHKHTHAYTHTQTCVYTQIQTYAHSTQSKAHQHRHTKHTHTHTLEEVVGIEVSGVDVAEILHEKSAYTHRETDRHTILIKREKERQNRLPHPLGTTHKHTLGKAAGIARERLDVTENGPNPTFLSPKPGTLNNGR